MKLGQPLPLSNFVPALNSGSAQTAGEHALALLSEEDAAKRFFVAVMKHDTALFIAEAVDQYSDLCLTGRRQIKMRRARGV